MSEALQSADVQDDHLQETVVDVILGEDGKWHGSGEERVLEMLGDRGLMWPRSFQEFKLSAGRFSVATEGLPQIRHLFTLDRELSQQMRAGRERQLVEHVLERAERLSKGELCHHLPVKIEGALPGTRLTGRFLHEFT